VTPAPDYGASYYALRLLTCLTAEIRICTTFMVDRLTALEATLVAVMALHRLLTLRTAFLPSRMLTTPLDTVELTEPDTTAATT
jgi:hypothetical protein